MNYSDRYQIVDETNPYWRMRRIFLEAKNLLNASPYGLDHIRESQMNAIYNRLRKEPKPYGMLWSLASNIDDHGIPLFTIDEAAEIWARTMTRPTHVSYQLKGIR